MIESSSISHLLLPELEAELIGTRKVLEALPDGHVNFKPHDKSMLFGRLAGHTAELPGFATMILTSPADTDIVGNNSYKPLHMESKVQLLAAYNEFADTLLTTVKNVTDEVFQQHWTLNYGGRQVYSGSRYNAFRSMGLNQMIHHRGQLTVYLRLLNQRVPGVYGTSADEK